MRSSTLASIVTAILSIHGVVALNHRRYPTALAIHTIAATESVYRRHDHEGENRGGDKGRDDGGEYGFGGTYDEDKPISTPSKNGEEIKPSISKSTQSVTPTVSEGLIATSSEATPVEESSIEAASSPVSYGTTAKDNEKNVSTEDNSNLQASVEASCNGNGMQLSFVPTTVFETGKAPTVTVTAAPRTITQVQVTTVTAPQELCKAAPASALESAEPVIITVTQSAAHQEVQSASTITVTESAPHQHTLEPVTLTVVQTAAQQPVEQLTITQQQFVTQTTTIHASATGIKQIDAVLPEGSKSTIVDQNQNQGEYAKTMSQTLVVMPTPTPTVEHGGGSGTVAEGGQCQCACPCSSKEFKSTRFSIIPGTPPVDASMPEETGADEPTTTIKLRLTQTTFETIIMSGTSEASAALTTSAEAIELDPAITAAPIVIASSVFYEPVISSIPIASFGQGETTPGVVEAEPTATNSENMDTSIALDKYSTASIEVSSTPEVSSSPAEETAPFFTTTLNAPLETPEVGAISQSQANENQAGEATKIVLTTSTIASSTATETAIITSSSLLAEESAPFFTTTIDGPLETPEIGAIPANQASGEAENSEVDTEIVLATRTIASSTVTATAVMTPSPFADDASNEEVALVFTTTIDGPLETPEIGAIPKEQAEQGSEFLIDGGDETPAPVPSEPPKTNAQVEALVTRPAEAAAGGEDEEVDISKYTLSSKIELGNIG